MNWTLICWAVLGMVHFGCAVGGSQMAIDRKINPAVGVFTGLLLGPCGLLALALLRLTPDQAARHALEMEQELERLRAAPPPKPVGRATAEEEDDLAFLAFRSESRRPDSTG